MFNPTKYTAYYLIKNNTIIKIRPHFFQDT
ncbi:uncharacterized protein METZ01_LOCUS292585 [marine metagenome]|uniref:Uncharacterized protein n=1 Tax=marine metagenome TaxID=408172 RepID=A0A382LXV0_9ZZZZ